MVFRPATPGFVVTLAATVCLALVSFSVPLLKSIYFLSATINVNGLNGTATFGTLGYCVQTGAAQACSNATVGWEFDPDALFGLNLPFNLDIPEVVVKWITYTLVLHIVALGLAGISAIFGLLAHVREMAMTCFSSCFSGLAATVCLIAFIFDLVFFLVIRSRIRAVGGTAKLGSAFWMTLIAWISLFFAGVCFGIGRCCFASRPRAPKGDKSGWMGYGKKGPGNTGGISHSEAMRMEAVRAEEERKARQAEVGLPAFPTNSEARPLKLKPDVQYYVEEDSEEETTSKPYGAAGAGAAGAGGPQRRGSASTQYTTNYAGRGRGQGPPGQGPQGGYLQGAPGTRSIDQYNAQGSAPSFPTAYGAGGAPIPNRPQRQPSANSSYSNQPYSNTSSPPPMPVAQPPQPSQQGYLAPGGASVGEVFPSHGVNQSSYYSATSHHTGQPSSYSQFDQSYNQQNDSYYSQQNQAPGGYSSNNQQGYNQDYGYNQGGNNGYGQQQEQGGGYAPLNTRSPGPYSDPYSNNQGYGQQQQQQQQSYNSYGGNGGGQSYGQQLYAGSLPPGAQAPGRSSGEPPLPPIPEPSNTNSAISASSYGSGGNGYGAGGAGAGGGYADGAGAGGYAGANNEQPRSPTSPRGPRAAGQGHVAAPWNAQAQGNVPAEAPPGYTPSRAGYPQEKQR